MHLTHISLICWRPRGRDKKEFKRPGLVLGAHPRQSCRPGNQSQCKTIGSGSQQHISEWQDWMCQPHSEWPIKKDFAKPPQEEMRKGFTSSATNAIAPFISRFRSLQPAVRTMATVIVACRRWRRYRRPRVQPPSTAAKYIPNLNPDDLELAERYLIQEAQLELQSGELESLLPEKVVTKGAGNDNVHIILVGGRARVRYRIGYNMDGIPVLPCKNQLSRLYMTEAHNVDHGGVNTTVMRSRAKVWIIQGAKLAKKVVNQCYRCRLSKKKLLNQVMAPLPEERMKPAPVLQFCCIGSLRSSGVQGLGKKESHR